VDLGGSPVARRRAMKAVLWRNAPARRSRYPPPATSSRYSHSLPPTGSG